VLNDPVDLVDPLGLTAYNCRVPLHSMPWSWGLPFMYHQYSCVEINATIICDSMDRTGNFL